MTGALVTAVRTRAAGRCEYCRLAQSHSGIPFEIDHIIARKHGGTTVADNLALSCFYCNSSKGPNIAGLDLESGEVTALFNPRTQVWQDHFVWNGAELVGKTAIGRATVIVLRINDLDQLALRIALLAEGVTLS